MHISFVSGNNVTNATAVAFTAYSNTVDTYQPGEIMKFPNIITNIGSAYDNAMSSFFCPVNGLYVFAVSLYTNEGQRSEALIAKDGLVVTSAFAEYNEDSMATNMVFLECGQGDRVEIRCGNVYDSCSFNGNRFLGAVSFSGALIYVI